MTMFAPGWRPAVDIFVTPTTVEVTLEIPGVSPEDVRVDLTDNAIVIEGRRQVPQDVDARGIYHIVEIRRGPFRAELTLPARVEARPRELHSELGLLFVSFKRLEGTNGHS